MKYWLVKSDPDTYAWSDFCKEKKTYWDGVRNYQARNNLNLMTKNDVVLFYESGESKSITGLAIVSKPSFPDPTNPEWVAIELTFKSKFRRILTLSDLKKNKSLENMTLIKHSRLSVQPVKEEEYNEIILISGNT